MKKIIILAVVAVLGFTSLFAQTENQMYKYITTDFAYYPLSAYIKGKSHFAPLTGPYSGLEGRVTGHFDYTIPTPLGSHWLVNSANVSLNSALEISPVSIKPAFSVSFTPVPFLNFSAGAQFGTGWELAGLKGMALFDNAKLTYTNLTPFVNYFYKFYIQGTFQFDTGAIFQSDWSHVVMLYTYQLYYAGITGTKNSDIWEWQCANNQANGLVNYQCAILAYQMPLVLYRAGVMLSIEQHYNSSDFSKSLYPGYNGSFASISIEPLLQFNLGKKDQLTTLFSFSNRRSFEEDHTDSNAEPLLTYAGQEWYFRRIAISWTHNF